MSELINPTIVKTAKSLKSPPGYELSTDTSSTKKNSTITATKKDPLQIAELKVKKAWEVALGPAKSIPMNLIMSYMTGNSLQIIPIMMTFMLLLNPLRAIFSETNSSFRNLTTPENGTDILLAKIVFVICQLGCAGVGVWKLNSMGLIPNNRSDWLAWEDAVNVKEWSSIF
ncbi:ER membrane protein complex subunit 4 [[Candida] anglica]